MTAAQLISFARGAPSLDIVDVEGLKNAAIRAFDADPAGVTATARQPVSAAARMIAARYGVPGSCSAPTARFRPTRSSSSRARARRRGGRGAPTYDRTLLSLRTMGASVQQVTRTSTVWTPTTAQAAGVGRPTQARARDTRTTKPAGVSFPAAPVALIELAREYGFLIFEDDPYAEIRFRGEPLPSLLSLDMESAADESQRVWCSLLVHQDGRPACAWAS